MTCIDRGTWTGYTTGTTAPALGAFADSGAVANGRCVMPKSVASHSLR